MEEKVIVELCKSNSIGNRFYAPTIKSWREVTKAEAAKLLAKPMANGHYWRIQPDHGN